MWVKIALAIHRRWKAQWEWNIGNTHCKSVYNKNKSILSFKKECTILPLKYFKSIYIIYVCICLSIYLYLGRQFPKGLSHACTCCTHMTVLLFQSYFARMSDVYIANSIKNKVSLLSKGNVHLKPWKRKTVYPSGARAGIFTVCYNIYRFSKRKVLL